MDKKKTKVKDKPINDLVPFNIITVGNSKVGKSCLLLRFFGKQFAESHISTIGIDKQMKIIEKDQEKYKFFFWDTTGQEKFTSLARQYFRKAIGIYFVYSIEDAKSFKDIDSWVKNLKDISNQEQLIKILIGNKNDLENKRKVTYEEGKKLAEDYKMDFFFETSAKTMHNVNECFDSMVNKVIVKFKDVTVEKNQTLYNERNPKKKKKCCT